MQNSKITTQHSDLSSTELLAGKLQNVPEVLARLCGHLLMSYKGGDLNFKLLPCIITITFISLLMHSVTQNVDVKIYVL
jgi:hypothetical protein